MATDIIPSRVGAWIREDERAYILGLMGRPIDIIGRHGGFLLVNYPDSIDCMLALPSVDWAARKHDLL